VSYIF